MTKDKTVRELQRELKIAKDKEWNERKISSNKNLDYIGPDPTSVKKDIPDMADIPDYVGLPKKKKRMTENKW